VIAGLLTSCLDFNAMAQEVPPAYIEPRYALRFYPGNEDTRVGWAHLASGNYGLAEQHYRRVVEATPQNGSAWIGLAASYDRLGRFDLADLAYRHAIRLEGENYIILNNRGYSYLLRGTFLGQDDSGNGPCCLFPVTRRSPSQHCCYGCRLAYFHGFGP